MNRIYNYIRKPCQKILGPIFYQSRLNSNGDIVSPRAIICDTHQKMVEQGIDLPWLMSEEQCSEFWSSRSSNDEDDNHTKTYSDKDLNIVNAMHEFWKDFIALDDNVLELGCNCGANLNGLFKLGYKDLNGVEINNKAIDWMKSVFPEMASKTTVHQGLLQNVVPDLKSNSYDLIFTMAVLIHVHPKSNFLFQEMKRVAKKYVAVVECETANCNYVFARNYKRMFEQLGCKEVKAEFITKETHPQVARDYDGFIMRLFDVNG